VGGQIHRCCVRLAQRMPNMRAHPRPDGSFPLRAAETIAASSPTGVDVGRDGSRAPHQLQGTRACASAKLHSFRRNMHRCHLLPCKSSDVSSPLQRILWLSDGLVPRLRLCNDFSSTLLMCYDIRRVYRRHYDHLVLAMTQGSVPCYALWVPALFFLLQPVSASACILRLSLLIRQQHSHWHCVWF